MLKTFLPQRPTAARSTGSRLFVLLVLGASPLTGGLPVAAQSKAPTVQAAKAKEAATTEPKFPVGKRESEKTAAALVENKPPLSTGQK